MRKKLMFVFCLISLGGFLGGLGDAQYASDKLITFLQIWIYFSIPLIIQLIYISIFRER